MQNSKPFLYISLTMNLVLVNPRMYTLVHTPIVVQGGGGGGGWGWMEPLPGVFDTLQYYCLIRLG